MKSSLLFLSLIVGGVVLLCSHTSYATPRHAVALHGEPKYPENFSHFSYVNPDAPKGGTLTLAGIGTFDSTNPFIIKGNPAEGISGLIYESLMEQSNDEAFSLYGLIAQSIERDKKNKFVIFNLRENAKWSDGKPITSEDVEFSFQTLIKDGAPFFRAYYADVDTVQILSDRRIRFDFKTDQNKELPLILAQMPILPKHFWTDKNFSESNMMIPLGSGPYKVESIDAGRTIVFVKDKNWWGKDLNINRGRYNFERVEYKYFLDQTVALEAFFAGDYDVQQENIAKSWATSYNAPPVLDGRILKAEIANQRPSGMQGFIYNIRRPIFQDKQVRKALAYAFDFEWSNKKFAYGAYTRTHSYFQNSELAAVQCPSKFELAQLEKFRGQIPDEVFRYTYTPPRSDGSGNNRANLKEAVRILEEAGYKLAKDGIRVHEETGQRLSFEMIDQNPAFERWTLPFIQNLKKIGVEARFRVVDQAQYINRMKNFDFDMTSLVLSQSNSPGNEQIDYWHSSKADMAGSRNYIGIKDPVVDQLIEKIIRAQTRKDLVTATRNLDRVLQWNYYVIPHWYVGVWRLAWWSHLDKPKQLSPLSPGIVDTWWVKEK
jgi:microcin C transport system substrate-binding protein